MLNTSRKYYKVKLGRGHQYATKCFEECVIGSDLVTNADLSSRLPEEQKDFKKELIPVYLANYPDKEEDAAGIACDMLYTICKKIKIGDIVLCPDGKDSFRIGKITGDYIYRDGWELPHTRPVDWLNLMVTRKEIGKLLYKSMGTGPACNIDQYAEEIEELI